MQAVAERPRRRQRRPQERPHRRRDPLKEAAYERLRLKLKKARMDAGLTQVEVARRLGRPQSFVSKVETRERRVDFIELQVLAGIYGKDVSFFEDDEGFGDLDRITTADIAALETARA